MNEFTQSNFILFYLYSATEETNRELTTDEMYMIDSGGQYLGGTTDVTRTVHQGNPTDFQKVSKNSVTSPAIAARK